MKYDTDISSKNSIPTSSSFSCVYLDASAMEIFRRLYGEAGKAVKLCGLRFCFYSYGLKQSRIVSVLKLRRHLFDNT